MNWIKSNGVKKNISYVLVRTMFYIFLVVSVTIEALRVTQANILKRSGSVENVPLHLRTRAVPHTQIYSNVANQLIDYCPSC